MKARSKVGDEIADAIDGLMACSHQLLKGLLRGRELTPVQYYVLRQLTMGRDLTSGEAARQLGVAPQTLTPIVDSLERSGRITRVRSPTDRRATYLRVTPEGLRVLAAIQRASRARLKAVLGELAEEEVRAVARTIRQITENLGTPVPES